ncbi:MAG: thioredoxin family protein [Bacilli bacterium]
MKKRGYLVLLLLILVCFVTGCDKEYSNLKEINYKELAVLIDKKETFILEVVKTGCSACETYTPTFNEVLRDNKIKGYLINLAKVSEKDKLELDKITKVSATPTTVFIIKGEEESTLHRLVGNVNKDKIITKLKSLGYIKEN